MALALIGGAAAYTQFKPSSEAMAQASGQAPQAMPVPVIVVEEKPVQVWKEFSGRLTAVDSVEVRPQVSGLIEKINFEDGQYVKAGEVLYQIDPRPYEAAVGQARADLAAAKDDARFSQKELKRAQELLKTGAVSQQGYDERVNSKNVNKSAIEAAESRLKSALVDLDRSAIKAPISGRIGRKEITEGNLVNASSAPLLTTIVSDKDVYADFEVDEQTYLTFVRQGTSQSLESEREIPVRLFLQNDTKPYDGKIKTFDNRLNTSTGTIRARATFANDDGALLPGMFARVQIGSASQETRITVPQKAINTDQSKKFVYVVGEANAATYREVTLGDTVGEDQIVLSGLQPGDKVIVEGLMKLRPGVPVDPKTAEEIEQMKTAATPPAEAQKSDSAQQDTPSEDKPAQQ